MIRNLTIKNFKAHKSIEMKELANVNILLGKNNSGKTAVLEALFFLSIPSSPRDILVRLNELRGYGMDEDTTEVWDSIFHNWDRTEIIKIGSEEITDKSNDLKQNLTVQPIVGSKLNYLHKEIGVIESSDLIKTTGLLFSFKSSDGKTIVHEVNNLGTKVLLTDVPIQQISVVFISARGITDSNREAIRFSQLEISNRQNEIFDILKIIEPNLKRLFVGATKKGSVIYGDIGIERPVPLPLMGDGILHAISIALAMLNSQNGLVLIDEIENGLHYSVLTDVWKMIFQTSLKLNVQVFVATHSDECIKAAYEAVESLKCDDSLKLYRFDRTKDGTRVVDYTANELYTAIASEQEVR
jgi:AAA15 family ATPase/GTPase